MKKVKFISIVVCLLAVLLFSSFAFAALQTIGTATYEGTAYNLIYDNDTQLTWLDYSHSAGSWDNWDDQVSWASGLNTGTVLTYNFNAGVSMSWNDDWRLPTHTDTGTVGCDWSYNGTDCGWNVDTGTGEMAHLFHDELGNLSHYVTAGTERAAGTWGLQNTGGFANLQAGTYWTGTEFVGGTEWDTAWQFNFGEGSQWGGYRDFEYLAIAVRPGLAVVPEPISSTLFIVGGATLGLRRFRKKQINI